MFGLFEKKKEKTYFCTKCKEFFTDKHLQVKNYTGLKCPFCSSLECYEIKGRTGEKENQSFK